MSITKNFNLTMKPKRFTKEYLKEHDIVLRNKELVVEVQQEAEDEILRYKIGDGLHAYSQLPYVSSLYNLYPKVVLWNKNYTQSLELDFTGKE